MELVKLTHEEQSSVKSAYKLLENRQRGHPFVSSNLTASAISLAKSKTYPYVFSLYHMQTHIPEMLGFAALASLAVLAWWHFMYRRWLGAGLLDVGSGWLAGCDSDSCNSCDS